MLHSVVTKLIASQTARHFFISGAGTLVSGVLGFIFYAVVARGMDPSSLGFFSIAIATIVVLSDIANIGINTGIVSFVAESLQTDSKKALGILKIALILKLCIASFIIIVGWITAPVIASSLLAKPDLTFALRLSFIGVAGMLFFSFSTSALQSMQKFSPLAVLNIGANSVRLATVMILLAGGMLTSQSAIISYVYVLFLFFFIGFSFIPKFWSAHLDKLHTRTFVSYNLWVAVLTAIGAITSRIDVFLLARISTLDEVGRYSVAVSFVSIIPQMVTSLAVVVAPKFASFKSNVALAYEFFKKIFLFFVATALLITLTASLLATILMPLFYGSAYQSSIVPAIILIVGQGLFIASIPIHISLLYFFKDVKKFALVGLIQMALVFILGIILIERSGSLGAALAILGGNVLNFIIPGIIVLIKFSNHEKKK